MTIPPSAPSTLVTSEYLSFSSPNCSLRSPISSATFPLVDSSALLFIISIFFKLSLISITSSFTTLRLSANPSCFLSISFCLSIIRLISIFSDTKILSHLVHKNFTPRHNVVPETAFFNSPYNKFETLPHFICTHFLQYRNLLPCLHISLPRCTPHISLKSTNFRIGLNGSIGRYILLIFLSTFFFLLYLFCIC